MRCQCQLHSNACCLGSGLWLTSVDGRVAQTYEIHHQTQGTLCPFLFLLLIHFPHLLALSFFTDHCFFLPSPAMGDGSRERENRGGETAVGSNVRKSRVSQPGNYTVSRTTVTHTHRQTHTHPHKAIKHASHMSLQSDRRTHLFP